MANGSNYFSFEYSISNFLESFCTRRDVDLCSLENLHLTVSVFNEKKDLVEVVQDIIGPAVVEAHHACWGRSWHMQTPLENIEGGCSIALKLSYGPTATPHENILCCGVLLVDKEKIDSGSFTINFSMGETLAPRAAKRRQSLLMRTGSEPPHCGPVLEAEVIISKMFRRSAAQAELLDSAIHHRRRSAASSRKLC